MEDRKAWTDLGVFPNAPSHLLADIHVDPEDVVALVNLSLADAQAKAAEMGAHLRITVGDGSVEWFEQDFNPNRIDIEVRGQKVVRVVSVG